MTYEYCVVTPQGECVNHTREATPDASWQAFCGRIEADRPLFRSLAAAAGYKVIPVPKFANDKGARW